jgi:5-methylcytosine-specific restriction protein B
MEYKAAEHGPFTKNGTVTQTYLTPISSELASFLTGIGGPGSTTVIPKPDSDTSWTEFIRWVKLLFEWDGFDATERDYKLKISDNLRVARDAFLTREDGWQNLVKQAFGTPNNLTPWRIHAPFLGLVTGGQMIAERALAEIWRPENELDAYQEGGSVDGRLLRTYGSERLSKFIEILSEVPKGGSGSLNMLEVLGSFLLMGMDPYHYPIYRADPFNKAYRLTDEVPARRVASPLVKYERAVAFLSDVLERSIAAGTGLRDLLDAQSVVWSITKGTPPENWDEEIKADFLRYRGELPPPPPLDDIDYWMVSPWFGDIDRTRRFIDEGIWENANDIHSHPVQQMKVGDRIAIRTRGSQTSGLPFDNFGNTVSKFCIHAVGTISANPGDGKSIEVDWEEPGMIREWYFYTLIRSVWHIPKDSLAAGHLIRSVFYGEPQDYEFFSEMWWPGGGGNGEPRPYSAEDVINEGVFLTVPEVELMIRRLQIKRNVILQGSPGVGKTFVTRKLAYALMGSKDDGKITTIQLHPSYSYEDFVRGYRPTDEAGRFEIRDGPFLRVCEAAYEEPDSRYVIIIDEINRGNLSQVFGEMFSLLESDKRGRSHALTPLYRRNETDTVSVPENLFIIDTKYYREALVSNRGGALKFTSENLYQIYAYLRTQEWRGEEYRNARGMLLYPTVHQGFDEQVDIQGHNIRVSTIDLADSWEAIETRLLSYV